jgi:integrase
VPAETRGHVYALRGGYGIRWRDPAGVQRRRSSPDGARASAPFPTRTAARAWLRQHLESGLRPERESMTFSRLVDEYLASHRAEPSTLRTLRLRLVRPVAAFGDLDLGDLETRAREISAWRATLPPRSAYGIVSAFRQVLEAGVRWRLMRSNPVRESGPNRQPRRAEVEPFTLAEVDRIAAELGPRYSPLVVFAAETALRPAEWLALEWRDVQRAHGAVVVERTLGPQGTKPFGKTDASRRSVPLSRRALAALDGTPRRAGSPLVFPAWSGMHLDLNNWRRREWQPALEAAGVDRRRIYDLRHTAISNWLAAGIGVFEVSRYAGTSLAMISSVYGHLTVGAMGSAAARMDSFADVCATTVPQEPKASFPSAAENGSTKGLASDGPGGIRTPDRKLRRLLLCPLSYGPAPRITRRCAAAAMRPGRGSGLRCACPGLRCSRCGGRRRAPRCGRRGRVGPSRRRDRLRRCRCR